MSRAAELYQLQELDLATDTARSSLAAVEGQLGGEEVVMEARAEVERRETAFAQFRRRQRDLELDMEALRQRVKTVEAKLYSGSLHNPRELADLQQDLQGLTRQLRKQEDEVLGLMLQAEEAEAAMRATRATLGEVERNWRREQEELQARQAALQAELATLAPKRALQAEAVDEADMILYSLLQERRQGQAVAKVGRGMCLGCRITLPSIVLQRARLGANLVQCPSCERILSVS